MSDDKGAWAAYQRWEKTATNEEKQRWNSLFDKSAKTDMSDDRKAFEKWREVDSTEPVDRFGVFAAGRASRDAEVAALKKQIPDDFERIDSDWSRVCACRYDEKTTVFVHECAYHQRIRRQAGNAKTRAEAAEARVAELEKTVKIWTSVCTSLRELLRECPSISGRAMYGEEVGEWRRRAKEAIK